MILLAGFNIGRSAACWMGDIKEFKIATLMSLVCLWIAFDRIPAEIRRVQEKATSL